MSKFVVNKSNTMFTGNLSAPFIVESNEAAKGLGVLDDGRIVKFNSSSTSFNDITGTASLTQIPYLPASKINSGVLDISRVNSVLTGFQSGPASLVSDTDTIMEAIAKLQAQITDLST